MSTYTNYSRERLGTYFEHILPFSYNICHIKSLKKWDDLSPLVVLTRLLLTTCTLHPEYLSQFEK